MSSQFLTRPTVPVFDTEFFENSTLPAVAVQTERYKIDAQIATQLEVVFTSSLESALPKQHRTSMTTVPLLTGENNILSLPYQQF